LALVSVVKKATVRLLLKTAPAHANAKKALDSLNEGCYVYALFYV
jgi:hypothetical protein